MAEPADLNVDELRRRARRRLIGAIVLALGAAVIVPMLLESDPKPLGEDVSVRIPPIDNGKFENRLPQPQAKGETKPAAKDPASAAPAKDSAAAKDAATLPTTPRPTVETSPPTAKASGRESRTAPGAPAALPNNMSVQPGSADAASSTTTAPTGSTPAPASSTAAASGPAIAGAGS